jgi:hypothetical protein
MNIALRGKIVTVPCVGSVPNASHVWTSDYHWGYRNNCNASKHRFRPLIIFFHIHFLMFSTVLWPFCLHLYDNVKYRQLFWASFDGQKVCRLTEQRAQDRSATVAILTLHATSCLVYEGDQLRAVTALPSACIGLGGGGGALPMWSWWRTEKPKFCRNQTLSFSH